ncbi:MAG: ATP-binding protein [Candidatus Jordarchaeum sp.]|uniref:ATP-binding protein n=1 Tax=Candidatus Jordarchaeum sp. TaxID=2823881 RepID=UPI00404AAB71
MGIKIAVVGKGGTGKTTVAGSLARLFARDGFNVFAIDADPSMNLYKAVGVSNETMNKVTPISEMHDLVEERTGARPGSSGGVFILNPKVSDIPDRFKVAGPDNVQLLVMGTVTQPSGGCMCPSNSLVRALLSHLVLKRDEVIIMDMVAGIEHLGRGTAKAVDAMIIIVEPGARSLDLAGRIKELAEGLGVKKLFIVANKVADDEEAQILIKAGNELGLELLAVIPYDREIVKADLHDKAPLDAAPDSEAMKQIMKIRERLEKEFA